MDQKFDGVVLLCSLEDGLERNKIIKILDMINDDCEMITINVSGNNTSAYGFLDNDKLNDEGLTPDMLENTISLICEDWGKLPHNNIILLGDFKVYVDFYDEIN